MGDLDRLHALAVQAAQDPTAAVRSAREVLSLAERLRSTPPRPRALVGVPTGLELPEGARIVRVPGLVSLAPGAVEMVGHTVQWPSGRGRVVAMQVASLDRWYPELGVQLTYDGGARHLCVNGSGADYLFVPMVWTESNPWLGLDLTVRDGSDAFTVTFANYGSVACTPYAAFVWAPDAGCA